MSQRQPKVVDRLMVHQAAGGSAQLQSQGLGARIACRYRKNLTHLLVVIAVGTLPSISGTVAPAQLNTPADAPPPGNNAIPTQESVQRPADKLAELGVEAFQQGRFKDAVRYLSAARKADPASPVLAAALGQAYMSAGDPVRAIEPFQDALAINPDDDSVRLALAQSYQRLDQDGKVVDLLKPQSQQGSPSPLWLFTLAFSQFRLEQYRDAEAIFLKLNQFPPMIAASSFFVANCKFGQNDLEGSLPWYEAAIHQGDTPQNLALNAYYYNYGLALFRLGRYAEASSAFLASTRRDSRDPLPLYFLGQSQARRGEAQDAISIFTQLIQKHPDFSPAYYQLGRLFTRTGDRVRSQEMFAKVKRIKDTELREQQLLRGMELGSRHDQGIASTIRPTGQ
jgi:tetratricopeptide (TPR) repeat protein